MLVGHSRIVTIKMSSSNEFLRWVWGGSVLPAFLGPVFLQFFPCLAHRALTAWPYSPLCEAPCLQVFSEGTGLTLSISTCRQTQPELPAEPQSSGEESSSEDDSDLFVNTNRRQYHESEEESEEEEAT